MATTDPYLTFDGNCAEAMKFYERVTGGKLLVMMTMGEAPGGCDGMPAGASDLIMHACIELDEGRMLMASDGMPGQYKKPQGFGVAITFPTAEEGTRAFKQLAEGGKVDMELGKTFWAEVFGSVTDRFGTPWLVNGGPIAMPKP